MGKRRKRLRMLKYAKKYALKRSTAASIEDRAEDRIEDSSLTSPEAETTVRIAETAKPTPDLDLQPVFEAPQKSTFEDEPEPKRAVLKKTQTRPPPTKKKATKTKKTTITRKKK